MRFLPLGQAWQAAVAAADYVVGDHGVPTAYAAAMGKPVFLANPMPNATPNSLMEAVVRYGKVLNPAVRLERQLDWTARPSAPITQRITSVPGRSTDLLRTQFLRLLRTTSPVRSTAVDH
jgi:hypothetical protein